MFKTIRAKILVISVGMLVILLSVLSIFTYLYYRDTKLLMINFASKNLQIEAEKINKEVIKIEKNARSLALMGELYYKFDKNKTVAAKTVVQVFENYPDSLGGGIWFVPYSVFPSQKLLCIYAYRDKNGKIVFDEGFEKEAYNYPGRSWYKEIISELKYGDNIEWSYPYYEKEGSDTLMITAGSGIYDESKRLVGLSTVDWEISSVLKTVQNIKPTKNSFVLFANADKDYIIVSTDDHLDNINLVGKSIKENIPWYNANLKDVTYITYYGKKYIPYVKTLDNGMVMIVCVPAWELFNLIFKSVMVLCVLLTFISFLVTSLLYEGLKRNVIIPIGKLIYIANRIGRGDNDVAMKIESPEEFAKLADTFDKMTKDIKTITKEREKINSELSIAKSIQMSSLPDIFPPFPDRPEFDIYASMVAAKEVGGDFYDFYFLDDNHFMFLIADVSGKGIPAALFMMTAKTLICNVAPTINDPQELINTINNKIYANNKNGLFITMFAGIVDVSTGELTCINCGHNPPLLKQNGGEYKYMELDSNMVLGVVENVDFNVYKTKLNEGDVIFTYTDGVTEATDEENNMYGEDRLINCINSTEVTNIKDLTNVIKSDVNDYTGDIAQSDDLTMLIFRYGHQDPIQNRVFKDLALKKNYSRFYNWLHDVCSDYKLDAELTNKIDMCAEEIFANISFYAYGNGQGYIEVSMSKLEDGVEIKFTDSGKAYNPLEKEDPDIDLPPEERPLGGLGIFMVKQMAKEVTYVRENDKNILTLVLL